MTQQMIETNQQLFSADQELRSAHELISDLQYQLVTKDRNQRLQAQKSNVGHPPHPFITSPSYDQSAKWFPDQPYEPARVAPSSTGSASAAGSSSPRTTPTRVHAYSTPQDYLDKRHHRTATPEQRQIRAIMKAPVYTLGIDPQDDRSLFSDFFQAIKNWAANYTVNLRTLSAEQIDKLAAHGAIASCLGQPSQLMKLITEKDMLITVVAVLISRHIFAHTIDEHGLYLSGHPNAQITEKLAYEWTRLLPSEYEKRDDLLQLQSEIYTAIKAQSDHKAWRKTCAHIFTDSLISSLSGLLTPNLPVFAIVHRNHIIQELYVKGYRIGFRLRMAAIRWDFTWPLQGATFNSNTMVNESRLLYGDVMKTMREIAANQEEHVVRVAISPTIRKRDWAVRGGGVGEVVHSGMVLVTRREWL
jgi:hypothetical protein